MPLHTEREKLFHATSNNIAGGILEPRYDIHLKKDLVFLTSNLTMAYGYCIKTKNCISNTLIDNKDCVIVIYDREKFFAEGVKPATIYQFQHSDEFVKTSNSEYTYDKKLQVDESTALKINGLDDVLKNGVQIFFINKMPQKESELHDNHGIDKDFACALEMSWSIPRDKYFETLAELIKAGVISYENANRNINPTLFDKLSITSQDCLSCDHKKNSPEQNFEFSQEIYKKLSVPKVSVEKASAVCFQKQDKENCLV